MKRSMLALALTLSVTSYARAQSPLSMDRAADEAIAQSPTLQAAVLAARSAQRLVREQEAYYQFMLQLDANGSVGNTPILSLNRTFDPPRGFVAFNYGESLDLGAQVSRALPWGMSVTARVDGLRTFRTAVVVPGNPPITTGPGYGFNAQLTVTQSLLRGFGETVGYASLYQARADRAGQDTTRDRAASGLLRDTLVAYWELWYAERAVEIQRSARDVIQRQFDDARQRTDLGALAGADLLTLEAQLATSESTIASAELVAANAAVTLARLLGRREGATLPATQADPPRLSGVATSDAQQRVLDQAPEVIEARARIESARVAATIAGQALMPVLNLSGTFQVLGLGYDDVGQTFSNFGSFTAVQFLGTLTYQTPLDDTQIHMEQERAQIAIQIAEQNYEAARAQALADATSAIQADQAATRRIELTEHAVDVAQRALAAQEERLALGSGLLIDVTTATQTLRQAELDRARAEVDAQEARLRLLHLVGELLGRFDERAPD